MQYLSVNKGMSGLTKALTALTRQQRHLAMRVIISTQGELLRSLQFETAPHEM